MGYRGGDGHVAIVVRPLDRTLNALKFVLVPLLAFAVSLPTARALTGGLEASPGNWVLVLMALLIVLAYAVVMKVDTVRANLDRGFAGIRRKIALACNHDQARAGDRMQAACRMTPEVFRVPLFQYDEQKQAVAQLAAACNAENRAPYWFVEGTSGCGKTRTALRLIQTLARDRGLCELGNRCYLYDLAESEFVQDELLRKLGTSRHDDAVVFVDNFQHVRPDVLSTLTGRLLEGSAEPPERLVVFLARPADAWNLSPRSDVRLLAEAKTRGHHIGLAGASPNTVTRFLSEFDRNASELVRDLEHEEAATAAQLHLAQVITHHRKAPAEALAVLRLLEGKVECAQHPELAKALAVITALSLHRGFATRRELRKAIRVAGRLSGARFQVLPALRIRLTFRRLQRIGLAPRLQLNGTRFLFHEAIAELCVDRLCGDPMFGEPFTAVGESRLEELRAGGDKLTAWLIAAEIGAEGALVDGFDAALGRGAYQRMARCLRRASARYELPPPARLQLAILLDRVGEFAASRAEFTDDLGAVLNSSDRLAVVLAASRIEASHDHASEAAIDALRHNPDPLAAIIGEYWRLHIAGHRGEFDSRAMLAGASELLALLDTRETHWLNYSLGRMHFDSQRQHYLEGAPPAGEVELGERRALDAYLEKKLPTYEAMYVLYGQAHLVGHVLLPKLAIFGQSIGVKEAMLAQVGASDVSSVDTLATTARRLYMRAREEFWQYGDREAEYLEADILNAEMIRVDADLDTFKARINAYQQFIVDTGFDSIFSYPHFYFFRLSMLKHYRQAETGGTGDPRGDAEHLDEAASHLHRITELDAAAGNRYGLLRSEMLSVLLRTVREPMAKREFAPLASRMQEAGYGFEARLMHNLAGRPSISREELRAVFQFYPFVHQ